MNTWPLFSRTLRFAPAVMVITCLLLFIPPAGAQTSGGPVSVPSCQEEGQRCYGGSDCINGICVNTCSGPFCQCDCDVSGSGDEGDGDIIWVVIIGTAILLGTGFLISRGRKKAAKGKEKDNEKKKPSVYILQLSTDRMTVAPDKPGQLVVTVWKQEPNGPLRKAPDAGIGIQVPATYPGLRVVPAAGQGMLTAQVRIEGSIRAGEVVLTVTAGAAGTAESATVTVVIEQDYVMEFF